MDDDEYLDKVYKRLRFLYAWATVSTVIGYGIIWYSVGFFPALGVFVIHSSILAGSHADILRNSIK